MLAKLLSLLRTWHGLSGSWLSVDENRPPHESGLYVVKKRDLRKADR